MRVASPVAYASNGDQTDHLIAVGLYGVVHYYMYIPTYVRIEGVTEPCARGAGSDARREPWRRAEQQTRRAQATSDKLGTYVLLHTY